MGTTALLPTATVVRMAWALTGKFSNDELSNTMANLVEDQLKRVEEYSRKPGTDARETSYVSCAISTLRASLRSLENAYKGRELNFAENAKIREIYLQQVEDNLKFGSSAKDFFKSLPSMTITSAGGLTVMQMAGLEGPVKWAVAIVLLAVGYLINLVIVRQSRRRVQMLYVKQDFDRDMYYDQYIHRVTSILHGLFLDLERIHERIFEETYEKDITLLPEIVRDILKGVLSPMCPFAAKHKNEEKITPELWAFCESGNPEATKYCPFWEGKKPEKIRVD
ncbi:MAG TPA: hypothetical protein PLW67_03760 [Prolixibacteraceae bacterium]|nr:hypothetical protein [Prolixibacteraceae bacterium]